MIHDDGQFALQAIVSQAAAPMALALKHLRPETIHEDAEMAEVFIMDLNRALDAAIRFKRSYSAMLRRIESEQAEQACHEAFLAGAPME